MTKIGIWKIVWSSKTGRFFQIFGTFLKFVTLKVLFLVQENNFEFAITQNRPTQIMIDLYFLEFDKLLQYPNIWYMGFFHAFCFAFFKWYFWMLKNVRLSVVLWWFFESLNRYILLLEISTILFILTFAFTSRPIR